MAQSQNTKVEFTIKATFLRGLSSYGDVMIGDKAFEYYNEKNPEDYIQIPWEEIDYISAEVVGKKITRFAIFTKSAGHFDFSTRDNIATLRAVREHVPEDRLQRSPSFAKIIGYGLKGVWNRTGGRIGKRGDEAEETDASETDAGDDSED
ncbi:MAG: DUF956 family protein [Tractidigestivibacter sp.]|uniref:DUF956 family protein n=1 Tax=Tractidigestivibacter sp. TaxID=2847320 RepID=UPI003D8B7D0A